MERPCIRALEPVQVEHEGQTMIKLHDPTHLAPATGHVSIPIFLAITMMDGTRTLAEIRAEFVAKTGIEFPAELLEKLVLQLDEMHFLASEEFDAYVAGLLAQPSRAATHAGGAYAAEADRLRLQLDAYFTAEGGPGPLVRQADGTPLRGLISPHIDFHRGNVTYAHTWKAAAQHPPAQLYLILGTCHIGLRRPFCVTPKSYETPLGPLPTDRAFLSALKKLGCGWMHDDELAHIGEHSIEFQAVMLKYLHGNEQDITAVPILVSGFHESISNGRSPSLSQQFQDFVGAVQEASRASGKSVSMVAGVDLAHVGPEFGDDAPVTPEKAAAVEREDREMLAAVERVDPEAFFASIQKDGDQRHVCGFGPIYTTLKLFSMDGPVKGKLVKYAQAAAPQDSIVSFAGVTFA